MSMASSPAAHDLENASSSPYTPLLGQPRPVKRRRVVKYVAAVVVFVLFVSLVSLVSRVERLQDTTTTTTDVKREKPLCPAKEGSKPWRGLSFKDLYGPETDWQRTSFHFQPPQHFMCDPNGPLYHMGWYHLFFQYNPVSAIWGNITWGHAVSKDMINWFVLPEAMVPEHWYDIKGVLSGSATVLPDGQIVMLFTGNAYDLAQLQCLATPDNISDPLLLKWNKYPGNPILFPPPGIGMKDFRDPSTAWMGADGTWRVAIGSKFKFDGITLLYKTTNFTTFELLDDVLHKVPNTGMWECIDFYPVSVNHSNGLDTSFSGPDIKHVLKESSDDDRHDYYSIGTYDHQRDKWTPDFPELDLGIGLRYDHGKFYASKSFYDPNKMRRLLWGYVGETDTHEADITKGWGTLSNIPRTVVYDKKTRTHLLQWPVKELETLRSPKSHDFKDVKLPPGSVIPLEIGNSTQLDITATFEIDEVLLEASVEADIGYNCTTSDGSIQRGVFGPFGLLVLTHDSLMERTPIYFYVSKNIDGSSTTFFCADEKRSSLAPDVQVLGKMIYGGPTPVLHGEKFTMRLLVDHSVVESFAMGGRTVITSRVYPTKAIYEDAKIFLFNNATGTTVNATLKIWHVGSAQIKPYPL